MNAELRNDINQETCHDPRGRMFSGLALIALGAIWLLNEFVNFNIGHLVLPALAAVFIIWGIATHNPGLLIPGGILGGIGTGILLMNNLPLSGAGHPGVFMLSFGAGFALITLLSALFTDETMWWAIYPGATMAVIGAALLAGGPALDVLAFIGKYWPVVLIFIGGSILLRRK